LRRRRSIPDKLFLGLFEFEDDLGLEVADLLRASAEVVGMVLMNTPQKLRGLPQNALRAVLPVDIDVDRSEGQRNSTLVSN
jgi:hypothetical protein